MREGSKQLLSKILVCALCVLSMLGGYFFVRGRSAWLYYVIGGLSAVIPVAYCAADGYKHVSRTVLVCGVVLFSVTALYALYYVTGLDKKFSDFDALKSYIIGSGFWGVAIFIGLTVFQVVVLPIPEAVTILLGVAIYGPTMSFILSVIGTLIGSLISFALGKFFGRKLCNWMFGEENTEKYAKIVDEKGRVLFILMLLFPAFPDDMLCMIAGITKMSVAYFTAVCLLTRPVMIGITAYLGSGVIPFSGEGIPVWIAIACLMFVGFVLISRLRKYIEKRKSL